MGSAAAVAAAVVGRGGETALEPFFCPCGPVLSRIAFLAFGSDSESELELDESDESDDEEEEDEAAEEEEEEEDFGPLGLVLATTSVEWAVLGERCCCCCCCCCDSAIAGCDLERPDRLVELELVDELLLRLELEDPEEDEDDEEEELDEEDELEELLDRDLEQLDELDLLAPPLVVGLPGCC